MNIAPYLSVAILTIIVSDNAIAVCKDEDGTRDSIYTKCLKPALDDADRKMLEQVQRLMKKTANSSLTKDTDAAERVESSQRLWLQFRDSHCEALGLLTSGGQSSRLIPEVECRIILTKRRISELQKLGILLR